MLKTIKINCSYCDHGSMDITFQTEDFAKWQDGAYVQDAFPYLSADEREMFLSQCCPDCWEIFFPDPDI